MYSSANQTSSLSESGIEIHTEWHFAERECWSTGIERDEFERYFYKDLSYKLVSSYNSVFAFHKIFHNSHKLELQWYRKWVKTENFSLWTYSSSGLESHYFLKTRHWK